MVNVTQAHNDCFPGLLKAFYSRDMEVGRRKSPSEGYLQPIREGEFKSSVTTRSIKRILGSVNLTRAEERGLI